MSYDLIGTTTLVSNTNAIVFSAIPSGYKDLQIILSARSTDTGSAQRIQFEMTCNNDVAAGRYSRSRGYAFESGRNADQGTDSTCVIGSITNNAAATYYFGTQEVYISNYSSTNNPKVISAHGSANTATSGSYVTGFSFMSYNSSSPITSLQFFGQSADLLVGSVATLYGIK